jgi:hypothetical protein
MYLTEWPKPSPTPVNTLVLLGITLIAAGAVYQGYLAYAWLIPLAVLLLIFTQGERAIYLREKRNYDGWRADMEKMMAHKTQDGRWERGVSFMKKGRRGSSRHAQKTQSSRRSMRKRDQQIWNLDDMAATEPMTG